MLALDRVEEGEAALVAAHQPAEAINSRRILWEILVTMADVAEKRGEKETAVTLRDQARAIIEFIAAQINEPDLREGFLSQATVRAVFPEV